MGLDMWASIIALSALIVGLVLGVLAHAIATARQREEFEAGHEVIDAAIGFVHTRSLRGGPPVRVRLALLAEDDRRLRLAVIRYRARQKGARV